jgi:hypothetical protein
MKRRNTVRRGGAVLRGSGDFVRKGRFFGQ